MAQHDKPSKVEILPPAVRDTTKLPLDRPMAGAPLVNRIRFRVARKELESYLAALRVQNEARSEMIRAEELKTEYFGKTLTRAAHIADLRAIEELKIANELEDLLEDQQIKRLQRRQQAATFETAAVLAEQSLEAVRNPAPATATGPQRTPTQRATEEIKRINADFNELKAAYTKSAGGEGVLDEEAREFLQTVDLARRNKIHNLLEAL